MSRQGSDPVVLNSSISLLQERFKQLQRVREKREPHRSGFGGQRQWFFPEAPPPGRNRAQGGGDVELPVDTSLSMAVGLQGHAGVPQSFAMIKEKDHVDTSLHL